jgi:transcriptional regulator with XRE-family HTH domain
MSTLFLSSKGPIFKTHDINESRISWEGSFGMKHKSKFIEGRFGKTLASLRKARGLTQEELAAKCRVSRRMIVYYERESIHPPVALLPDLARCLKVSVEQLLGVKTIKDTGLSKDKRLMRRLKQLQELSPKDQRSVLSLIKSIHTSQNKNGTN